MFKKLVGFILTLILAVVLVIGGIAGIGYYYLTKEGTTGQIATTVGNALGTTIEIDEEVSKMSLLDYAKSTMEFINGLTETKIGDIEGHFGLDLISKNLEEIIGLDPAVTIQTTLAELGTTISNNITLETMTEKFSVELPDLPLFNDKEFTSKAIATAFESMTDYNLDMFIDITYDDEATPEKPASGALMQQLGKHTLDYVSHNSQEIINSMSLGELMTISDSDPKALRAIKDYCIETQYDENEQVVRQSISYALDNLPLNELLDTGSSYVWNYIGQFNLKTLGTGIDNMTMGDAIEVTDSSHVVLRKLKNTKLSEIGTSINSVVEDCTLSELIDISGISNPNPIILAIKDTKLNPNALNERVNSLTIADTYKDSSYGVLSLIPQDSKLSLLPHNLSVVISSTPIYKLVKLGIISLNVSSSSCQEKAYLYNGTLNSIMSDLPSLLKGTPIAIPSTLNYADSELTQAKLDALIASSAFSEGDTIIINSAVTIPDDEVFTTRFNIDCTGGSLTIGDNVSFDVDGGYAYFKGTVAGTIGSVQKIKCTTSLTVDAFYTEIIL